MSSSRPRVAVVGSVNTDLVVYAPRLPAPGVTVIGGDLLTGGGGKGANQAVAAARLGADVRLLGRVGADDFGRGARSGLAAAGVDVTTLLETPDAPSGVAMIVVDERGENQIALAPGANNRVSAADVDAAWPHLRECAVLLLQLEIPMEAVVRAAVLGRQSGMIVVLNPAPAPSEPLPDELLRAAHAIVPNEHEASALVGAPVRDSASAAEAARRLRSVGVRDVIVTLGREGALVSTGDDTVEVPALPVQAVDTTAAGDAFCGGLAVGLARGDDLIEAARFAARVAALAVTKAGAQDSMPTLAEVESLAAGARP